MAAKSLVQNLTLGGVALLASLGIGEVALRLVVELPLRRVLPEVRYAPHPVRRFTLVPDQEAFSYGAPARIDRRGFRVNGPTAPLADADVRVLALGDSFTFGLGVRDEETWPAQLERRLAGQGGARVEVVNAGTISYGVFQEWDLFRTKAIETTPRLVVHALYWNDFMNATTPAETEAPVVDSDGYLKWDELSSRRGLLRRLTSAVTSSSALAFSARQAVSGLRRDRPARGYGLAYRRFLQAGLTPEEWAPIRLFYENMQRLAKEREFGLLVIIMPVSDAVLSGRAREHPYSTAARQLLSDVGIPHVDAFDIWSKQSNGRGYFLAEAADAHLNAAGYAIVAHAAAQAIAATPELIQRLRNSEILSAAVQ